MRLPIDTSSISFLCALAPEPVVDFETKRPRADENGEPLYVIQLLAMGDGSADLKPLAHLYKSQVFQLAEYLGVPAGIRARRPTTDTYSLEQSQEEFYFGLSLEQTDLCMYARDHGMPAEAAADAVGLTPEQMLRAYQVIDSKREAARYLHAPAIVIDPLEDAACR